MVFMASGKSKTAYFTWILVEICLKDVASQRAVMRQTSVLFGSVVCECTCNFANHFSGRGMQNSYASECLRTVWL
jgi:hypothetical protein